MYLLILVSSEDSVCSDQEFDDAMKHVLVHGDHSSNESFAVLFPVTSDDLGVVLTTSRHGFRLSGLARPVSKTYEFRRLH